MYPNTSLNEDITRLEFFFERQKRAPLFTAVGVFIGLVFSDFHFHPILIALILGAIIRFLFASYAIKHKLFNKKNETIYSLVASIHGILWGVFPSIFYSPSLPTFNSVFLVMVPLAYLIGYCLNAQLSIKACLIYSFFCTMGLELFIYQHFIGLQFATATFGVFVFLYFITKAMLDSFADINKFIKIISKLRTDNERLEELKELGYRQEQLASLGEMAGGIAHEINNPLMVIIGNTGLIRKKLNNKEIDKEKIIEITNKIDTTCMRITNIINGLKNLARDGTQDGAEEFSLQSLLDEVLPICNEKFRNNGIKIILDFNQSDGAEQLYFKRIQLIQVLVNLLNNSFDAILGVNEKWVKIKFEKNENTYILSLQDSGPGIPKNLQTKIMDPFFTTKGKKGTGLGLSISKKIMLDNGGDLLLSNNVNSQFNIIIPLSRGK